MKYGQLEKVENLDAKFGSAKGYHRVMIETEFGIETLLMTERELATLRTRVSKNPEDTAMVPTWRHRFVAFLARLLT